MFWRGVLGYLPANVIQGVVGLLTIVTFTRLLTPAQFGDYALGFSVMSLIHTAVFVWNEAAMARFWAGSAERRDSADHSAAVYGAWLVLLAALPLAALVAWLWPLQPGLKVAVLAGIAATAPRTLIKLAQERRRAGGQVGPSALIDMGQTLGGFALGAGFALAGFGGASPLIGAGLAALACLPFVLPADGRLAISGRLGLARVREHAAYGLPVALSLILALVLATTDRFLLARFLDEASVGVYHAGYSLANRTLDVVFIWLGAAGGPALIMALERGGRDALKAAAREQAQVMVLLTLPAAVGLALVAAPLAQLMIGPALSAGAAHVTPWIALSGLLGGLTTYYFHQAFTLSRRTGLLLVAMTAPALANLVLNLILIPRFGLDGALWATPASYALGLAASALLGGRSLPLPIPWRTVAEAVGASLAMALAVASVPACGGLPELILKAGLGALVYGAVIALVDAGALRSRAQAMLGARLARSAA
ncbi:polysaccharide biosynthesis C-terminal domain-containing protein [Phenylobacterium aquaticum]|uniref:polysaccharide biosynthesis protein HfsF n=1 Tax=Phenylobacterium aquaticum TaxID=1763816 RepID=UPI001F5D03D9|nr:lipopolysaccharide biosynthesis protein [Phenylobacterium aquaticum]MCI3131481.1 lipopolysaccharide biosynthesis protein [Phenylobacterium aquaticum]